MSYLLNYNPGTQQWGYPRRGASLSGTCIMHTAECAADNIGEDSSAETCASFIANRADWGSYHRLVDSDSIVNMLPFEYEAWQDSETNPWAVGISAALRTSDWLNMPADREDRVYQNLAICAAEFVRHMAAKGITVPLRRISGAQARARVPGFCAHGDSGVSRSDPGANFDWDKFFRYTAAALGGSIQFQGTIIEEADVANTDLSLQENTLKVLTDNKTVKGSLSVAEALGQLLDTVNGLPHAVLFGNRVEGRNIVDTGRQSLANDAAILAALSGLKAGATITPEDIAAAVPEGIAQAVADELAKRLAGGAA